MVTIISDVMMCGKDLNKAVTSRNMDGKQLEQVRAINQFILAILSYPHTVEHAQRFSPNIEPSMLGAPPVEK